MKTSRVLGIFKEAVEKYGFKYVSDFVIEKGDYRFKYYERHLTDSGFVGLDIKSEYSFFEYKYYATIETLKTLKMQIVNLKGL